MTKQEVWLEIFREVLDSTKSRQDFVSLVQDVNIIYEALLKATRANR